MGKDCVRGNAVLGGGVLNVPKGKHFLGDVIELSTLLEDCVNCETQVTILFTLQQCKNC